MRIIVDAFGGDNAPLEILRGAAMAVKTLSVEVTLVGREEIIRDLSAKHSICLDGMTIVDAPDVMEMEDEPRAVLKAKKNSSMAEGLRLLAAGDGDAFVSAGSTGALIMGATFIVKRIKGVSRPALAPLIPADTNPFLLIDCGANADCRPEMLVQFAQMGHIYMTRVLGRKDAKIGLLNIGTEECKGTALQQEAYAMLKESDLPFMGNIEARDVPAGAADIVVADGFTGNILLKCIEGTTLTLMRNIKRVFKSNLLTMLAAMLVKPQLGAFKKKMDVSEHGGAPIIGVAKPVIKAHGNSDAKAFCSAIRQAALFAQSGVIEAITEAVSTENKE